MFLQSYKKMACLTTCIVSVCLLLCSCNNGAVKDSSAESETVGDGVVKNAVTDSDGNKYDAVKLGEQVWMKSNLKYKGTLPEYRKKQANDVACYFEGEDGEIYYNGLAVIEGICPDGWHVPSENDWNKLEKYCMTTPKYKCGNSDTYIAKALADSIGWKYYSYPGTSEMNDIAYNPLTTNNRTGFSARGKGYAEGYDGYYTDVYFHHEKGERAYFWTSDYSDENNRELCFRVLMADEAILGHGEYILLDDWQINITSFEIYEHGLSIRCVKD